MHLYKVPYTDHWNHQLWYHKDLTRDYRFINLIINYKIDPKTYFFHISHTMSLFFTCDWYGLRDRSNMCIFWVIRREFDEGRITDTLPFGLLITHICLDKGVEALESDQLMRPKRPQGKESLRQSEIHAKYMFDPMEVKVGMTRFRLVFMVLFL